MSVQSQEGIVREDVKKNSAKHLFQSFLKNVNKDGSIWLSFLKRTILSSDETSCNCDLLGK